MLLNRERAQLLMEQEGVDGLVASTLENCFYMTGVWNIGQELFPHDTQAYVVATRDDVAAAVMVTSMGEADLTLGANSSLRDVVTYGRFFRELLAGQSLNEDEERIKAITLERQPEEDALSALVSALRLCQLDQKVVAVDERGPNRDLLSELQTRLPGATFVPASQLFRRIRMVKTGEELERMEGALRITENAFRKTVAEAAPGVTERELFHVFEQAITAGGARPGFTLLRFGRGMALGQVPAGDTQLQTNDYIWFDIGCTFKGYRSDIGRVVPVGEPSAHLVELFGAVRAGQDRAIELMTPGRLASEVFEGAMERVRETGIPHYKRHHVGHGIGAEFYDLPIITPTAHVALEPNMIFEVETPYYEMGFGGAFIEDTVLITESGNRILTELSRDLVPAASVAPRR